MDDGGETVFVGVPCRNRPDGLRRTIECMQKQSHSNWKMLISDNASSDPRVEEIGRAAADADPRISYSRLEKNLGAAENFRFVVQQADAPFFMWASDDDIWEPEFVETLLDLLRRNPDCQMAFSSIDNINRDGVAYRTYPGFTRLSSDASRLEDAKRFINDPEIMGKANLIYGLFRFASLQSSVQEFWDKADLNAHGGDVVFLFGFVSRYPVVGTDRVLLHKRVSTEKTVYRLRRPPKAYFVRLGKYQSYRDRHVEVAPDESTRVLVRASMRRRLKEKYLSLIGLA